MNHFLRMLFFALIVRPIMLVILGMNVRQREKLPDSGPAILIANHNSHLDVLALMCLFPLKRLRTLRPVAAQDYFFRNPFIKWFALRIMGILPLDREVKKKRTSPLAGIYGAIERNELIILFPTELAVNPRNWDDLKPVLPILQRSTQMCRSSPASCMAWERRYPRVKHCLSRSFWMSLLVTH